MKKNRVELIPDVEAFNAYPVLIKQVNYGIIEKLLPLFTFQSLYNTYRMRKAEHAKPEKGVESISIIKRGI